MHFLPCAPQDTIHGTNKNFQDLLDQNLKDDNSNTADKIEGKPKRKFLRKGEGTARFKMKNNQLKKNPAKTKAILETTSIKHEKNPTDEGVSNILNDSTHHYNNIIAPSNSGSSFQPLDSFPVSVLKPSSKENIGENLGSWRNRSVRICYFYSD